MRFRRLSFPRAAAFLPLAFCLALASESMAQTQVSTLGGSLPDTLITTPVNWYAVSFVTDAQPYSLNSVTLRLGSADTPANFTAVLYNITTSGPIAPLENLGGPRGIPIPNTQTDLTFPSAGTLLEPNTRYSVVYHSIDAPAFIGYFGSWHGEGRWPTDPASLRCFFSNNAGDQWVGFGPPFAFSVNATPVPEPAPLALLVAGALALGLYIRRVRKP